MTAPDAHDRSLPHDSPVTTREADTLDAWLESSLRHVGRSRDIARRSDRAGRRSPNGHFAPDASLQATAQAFHARLARAEHDATPHVPADAIWEKVMASTTVPVPATSTQPRHVELKRDIARRSDRDPQRPALAWLTGSHWAVSTVMLAAVVVGIIALYGSFAGSSGGDDPVPNSNFAMASPGAFTPATDAAWLQPYSPSECDVEQPRSLEEVGALTPNPGQVVPREYLPVTDVDPSLAEEVALAHRAWEACRASGLLEERQSFETLRYLAEIMAFDVLSPDHAETFDEWVALNESMRAAFLDPAGDSYLVESDALPPFDCDTGYADTDIPEPTSYELIQPQHLVHLPDGRIGGLTSLLVGHGYIQCLEEKPPVIGGDQLSSFVYIFAPDPTRSSRWALDERFSLCVTGCEDYYESFDWYWTSTTPEAATPVATPDEEASAGTYWLRPITAGECEVEPLSEDELATIAADVNDDPERSYAPAGPVRAIVAEEVAAADRAWQSCYVYGTAGERAALQSPRLTRDGPGEALGMESSREAMLANLDRFDASRELGEVMLSGNWRDYYIESDLFVDSATPNVDVLPDFIPTIPIPDQAVLLTDGRIAIPIAQLVPPGSYPFSVEDVNEFPYLYITVHILVQEPALDGRWVVDETIDVCMGDCDQARAEIVEYIAYLDSLVTPDVGTPVATPRAWRDPSTG